MLTDDGKRKKLQPKTYADLGLKKAGTSNKAESRVINSPFVWDCPGFRAENPKSQKNPES